MEKNASRQATLTAIQEFDFSDFESGVAQAAIEVPDGAVITGGFIVIDTAFNSGTSDTITVGDSDDEDRYAAGVNGASAAETDFTLTGYEYDSVDDVTITWTGVGDAPTAGSGRLVLEYIVSGRSHCTQG